MMGDNYRRFRSKTPIWLIIVFLLIYAIVSAILFYKGLGFIAIIGLFFLLYQYFAIQARRIEVAQDISQINEYYYELEEEKLREEEEYLRWRKKKELEKLRNARKRQARRNPDRRNPSNSEFKEEKEVNIEFGKDNVEKMNENEEVAK